MDLEEPNYMDIEEEEGSRRKLKLHKKTMMETRRGGEPKPDYSIGQLKRMKLADKYVDKMPKHLNSGKRGIGKTQRR